MLAAQQSNKINKEMGGMHPRENYNDLYVFVMVAQENLYQSSGQTGHCAIGRQPHRARFGARLGVQLLNRTTRKLSLTQAGGRLCQTAQESFQTLG